jgi:hypothetical protein
VGEGWGEGAILAVAVFSPPSQPSPIKGEGGYITATAYWYLIANCKLKTAFTVQIKGVGFTTKKPFSVSSVRRGRPLSAVFSFIRKG